LLIKRSVFLDTALILWALTVKPDPTSPINENDMTDSSVSRPGNFKVIFEPRAAPTLDGILEMLDGYGA
jgi:hypothetical protein